VTVDGQVVVGFLLVLARTASWAMTAPVFSTKGLASAGRLALALGVAMWLAPLVPVSSVPEAPAAFVIVVVGQVIVGLVLGWVTSLLLHAFEIAGSCIDVASGFSLSQVFDPISGTNVSIFSRFTNLLFAVLLIVTNGHHVLIEGLVRSFAAAPPDRFPVLGGPDGPAHAVGSLLVAALEVGAPVLGALFLTEVVLALAARAAPQANVFAVGLPAKVLVTFVVLGSTLVFLPGHVAGLLDGAVRMGAGSFH
jgi:flagellar biosynthesis protein FliR